MYPILLSDAARVMGGEPRGEEAAGAAIRGVAIDSRAVEPGDLFFCLPGARTDGHAFLGEAFRRGAFGAVVARGRGAELPAHRPWIEVEDPRRALGDLARRHRRSLRARVIAITGSNGKTTAKEMAAAVAETRFRTIASEKSYNNDLGVPLTILRADAETQVLILEMGTSGFGEIAALARLAEPEIGVVTSIGAAHLEAFRCLKGVARAKGELFEALPRRGLALYNADSPAARFLQGRAPCRVGTFGCGEGAAVRAAKIRYRPGALAFSVPDFGRFTVAVRGRHNVTNALAAIALGIELGVDARGIARGLSRFTPPPMRLEEFSLGGVTVVNDAYNANPVSVAAAIEEFSRLGGGGRRAFVCGEMRELGPASAAYHRHIGRLLAGSGADLVCVVGETARPVLEGLASRGWSGTSVRFAATAREAAEALGPWLREGDLVFLKGSRAVGLEEVVERLHHHAIAVAAAEAVSSVPVAIP